ncbi:MAG: branched-chain amino acid ABC transporter permease [Dehalococcoidia bacterium]|nr:branched-chain amino acid ABC transporter permease [Dehalococcoidia bacterium]
MLKKKWTKPLGLLVLALLLVFLPVYVTSAYYVHILIYIFVLAILAVGVRLVYTTGMVTFAHAAFYAIGAYTSATLVMRFGWSFWVAIFAAGVMSAIVALAIGYPVLRIKGVYFFLVSFAFGMVVFTFFSNYLVNVFGGPNGIISVPHPNSISIPGLPTLDFVGKIPYYYLALVILALTLLVMYRLDRSRFGLVCKSVREADNLAETAGVNIMQYKVSAFVIACFFAGVAGAFIAHYYSSATPDTFGFHLSVSLLVFMLVGGSGSVAGPVIGVAVLEFLAVLFVNVDKALGIPPGPPEVLLYGVILIIFILFFPGGLVSLPGKVVALFKGQPKTKKEVGQNAVT